MPSYYTLYLQWRFVFVCVWPNIWIRNYEEDTAASLCREMWLDGEIWVQCIHPLQEQMNCCVDAASCPLRQALVLCFWLIPFALFPGVNLILHPFPNYIPYIESKITKSIIIYNFINGFSKSQEWKHSHHVFHIVHLAFQGNIKHYTCNKRFCLMYITITQSYGRKWEVVM